MTESSSRTVTGKVYLVGAGPGDPGLLTLKGARCLAAADLVLYDGLVNPLLLRHSHASAVRTCRIDGPQGRTLDQAEINRQLVEGALSGKTVVRLKGGDPFIFGRGSEEAAALAEANIPYEVVPGITAATACAAYAGISLTHRDHASAVAFITGHERPGKQESAIPYGELARFPGTLVFYMGLHRLESIAQALMAQGKSPATPVAVICRGTTPQQRTVTGRLDQIAARATAARLRPPSLIVVGECVSLRETVRWFDNLPLFGLSIGITTPDAQAAGPIHEALSLGANPISMPVLEIQPVADWKPVDQWIDRLASLDWLVFTSVNGVDIFLNRMWERGSDARRLAGVHIAAIGEATAQRLEDHRLRADVVPETYRAEALAEALSPLVAGQHVLWVRANRGRDVLPEALRTAGAHFDEVVVYQHGDVDSLPQPAAELLDRGELDWVALSSPAIARTVARLIAVERRTKSRFAAISPVTALAAQESGLPISAVARKHTWPGLFKAIIQVVTNADPET